MRSFLVWASPTSVVQPSNGYLRATMANLRQTFLNNLAQTTHFPLMLEIDRAEGLYMYGANGKRYLDLISGISVSNLGHSHPKVVEAVREQAGKYMHLMVYGELVQSPQVRLAEKLCSLLPDSLDSVYFLNSGSEAVEGALKLAKRITGRTQLAAFRNSYHGSSHGAMSMGGDEHFKRAFRPLLPDVLTLEYGVEAELEKLSGRTAAVLMETVQAEAGVYDADPSYLKAVRAACDRHGIQLIFDEIQTGMGRTGSLFSFERSGVVPDILLLAKAFGGGMPLGAFISAREKMIELADKPILGHITTFGGHPVSCAAALASLEELTSTDLIAEVAAKADRFRSNLAELKVEIRNAGLMMALQFRDFEQNKAIVDECIANGVLTDWFLYSDNCLRIAPPLIITADQIDEACEVVRSAATKHS